MRLIGMTGSGAGCGKDTAAARLVNNHGFSSYAFATPIKLGIAAMFNLDDRHLYGELKEVPIPHLGVSPRRLMQTLGTEWGREMVRPDVWLQEAMERWYNFKLTSPNAAGMVITDVRFDDEAEWVRKAGGTVVYVDRPNIAAVEAHSSEAGITLKDDDIMVYNNGTLDDLYAQIDTLLPVTDVEEAS